MVTKTVVELTSAQVSGEPPLEEVRTCHTKECGYVLLGELRSRRYQGRKAKNACKGIQDRGTHLVCPDRRYGVEVVVD